MIQIPRHPHRVPRNAIDADGAGPVFLVNLEGRHMPPPLGRYDAAELSPKTYYGTYKESKITINK